MSTAAAQRALLEAIAAAHHGANREECGELADPLLALEVGVQEGIEVADSLGQPLIADIYDKLGCLVLAVRGDLTNGAST